MKGDITEEQLLNAMLNAYDIDRETAEKDISAFIEKLKGADLLA